MRTRLSQALVGGLVLAACQSCVYTASSALPAHIRSVRVEVFGGLAGYPGLEAELARAIAEEFRADGTLTLASAGADAVLRGSLRAVRRVPLEEDRLDDVIAGQMVVEALVTFEDSSGEALLRRELVTSRDVLPSEGIWRARRGEGEPDALASAVRALARNIVRRVVEVW